MKYMKIKDEYKVEIWPTLDKEYIVRVEKNAETLIMNKVEDPENIEKVFEDPIVIGFAVEIDKNTRNKVKNLISEGASELKERLK